MNDPSKTKQKLIEELSVLKQRIHELEHSESDRKQAESQREAALEALRGSENKYRLIAENTADLISILDMNLRFTYVSPASVRLRGFTVEEAMEQTLEQVLTPESMRLSLTVFEKEMQLEASGTADPDRTRIMELEEYKKDGSFVWMEVSLSFLRDKDRKPVEILIVSRDITERKRAGDLLREQQNKLSSIFRAAPIGIGMVINRMFWEANDTLCQITGYSREEFLGRNARMLYPTQEDYDYVGQEKYRQIGEKSIGTVETRWKRKDGRVIDIILSSTPLDPDDLAKGVTFTALDITDRIRTEKELRESEEKYRLLIENANEALYVLQDGVFRYVNRMCGEMLGVPAVQLIGVSMLEFLNPDDREKALSQHLQILCGELTAGRSDFRVLTRHGEERWADVNSVGITWDGKKATLNFATDITERRQAEEALKKSEEMLRLITENMSDMIRVIDLQGINVYVSPSHFKSLGYRLDERVGKSSLDIVHPDDVETIMTKFTEGLPGNQPIRVEYRVRHADGHYVWLDTVGDLLRDDQGNATTIVMSSRDISERKRAEDEKRNLEERLQRAEKMEALGTLAGGVAHDLNNVLGVIVGYAELLLNEVDTFSPIMPRLTKIMSGSEKAAAIVQDLLTLARRGVPGRKALNLNKVILDYQKSLELEKLSSCHSAVRIRHNLESALLNISGSSVHLGKVISNLVANALEAMPKGGNLTIKTANQYLDKPIYGYDAVREGDYVVLTVTDTGEGITSVDLQRIFEPFYTKKVMGRSGTGLGLAVVWGTVKDHQGYINVQSEEGKGSTFTLYFPVTREEISIESASISISAYMGKGEPILVVDDVMEQRDLAAEMLKKLNYKVSSVGSGEEAIAYIKEHDVDLLVLDMIMDPGMYGLDTYRSVLEIQPKQKAIIVSGFSETERVNEAHALGAGAYLRKPYVIEKLGLAVRKELDRQ